MRKLTLNECYKLMGFPENFIRSNSVSEQYRQIGNSVCIPMISSIVEQIKAQFDSLEKGKKAEDVSDYMI